MLRSAYHRFRSLLPERSQIQADAVLLFASSWLFVWPLLHVRHQAMGGSSSGPKHSDAQLHRFPERSSISRQFERDMRSVPVRIGTHFQPGLSARRAPSCLNGKYSSSVISTMPSSGTKLMGRPVMRINEVLIGGSRTRIISARPE
jgi:hypothetical protein